MNMRVFFGLILMLVGVAVLIVLVTRLVGISRDTVDDPDTPSLSQQVNDQSVLTMEKRGRITADENHYGYRIIIDDDRRILETYQGYNAVVTDRHVLGNNEEAFGEFVEAVSLTGLKGVADSDEYGDREGICAFGFMNTYTLSSGPDTFVDQFQTSCGTNSTNAASLEQLFIAQIPDFYDLTSQLVL